MTTKNYIIHPVISFDDLKDKPTRAEVDAARPKVIEVAKKELIKATKEVNGIKIRKEQLIDDGVMISIDEDKLEDAIRQLMAIDIVSVIDSYGDVKAKEETKKEKTSKEAMAKFLK